MNSHLRSASTVALVSLLLGCASSPRPHSECAADAAPPNPLGTPVVSPPVDPRYAELPAAGETKSFVPPKLSKIEVRGGTLYFSPVTHVPLVSVHLLLPLGAATDPLGKEGLTSLTVDLLDDGAGNYSELQLSDRLGTLATDLHAQVTQDNVVISMNALAENLEPSLTLLSDVVFRPKLGKSEFERARERKVSEAAQRSRNPQAALGLGLARAMFGHGYGGTPLEGTEKSLGNIRLEDVRKQATNLRSGEGASLVVVGNVSEDSAKKLAEKFLGGFRGKRDVEERKLESQASTKSAFLLPFPGATQSAIAVAKRGGPLGDPNYFAEMVYNRQIGEAFTSRINLNLREAKGYTYGATSVLKRHRKAGFFAVITSVQSQTTQASLEEIRKELGEPCHGRPLTHEEHDVTVQGLLAGFPGRFEMLEETALQVASIPIQGRPLDFFETWSKNVSSITLARAQSVGETFCDSSAYSIVIAGDPAVAGPALEKLGYRVEILDRDGESTSGVPTP